MADLKLIDDVLHESSESLEHIYTAFDKLPSRGSHTETDWGSSAIKDAMGDFTGGWDNHRHKVMKQLETMKKLVDETIAAFNDTENKLSNSLHQQHVAGREAQ
jgi:hypothetical protein